MLKKLIGVTYLLIISSLSFATGISTMTGDASLSGTIKNWNPAFADGNTIVVGADNISLTADQSVTIRSIRLDHTLKDIHIATPINLGAVSENGSINDISIAGTKTSNCCTLNLTGAAGEDNNPPANSYTGIKNINFWRESTLFINCPTTLACGFNPDGNNIKSIVYVNDDVLVLSGIGTMTDIIIAKNKTLTIDNNSVLNSHFDFSDLGTLLLSGENTIFNPSTVSNVESAVLNIKNNVTTNMPSVLTINTINISDGKSFTIDALNSDINLLKNHVSVNFIGNNAAIVLTNSANTDRQFTLFTHLNPSSTTDNYGIVKIRAITTGLTIANNAGTYTIGQDNTHRLQNFIVEGSGSIVVDHKVFTGLLSMNSIGQVIFNQALDLGVKGNIAFGVSGKLTLNSDLTGNIDFAGHDGVLQLANGRTIKGNVDSSNEVAGTLEFLGAGTVEGTIGKTNALNTLKFSGAGDITLPKANAKIIEVANAQAKITANDTLEGNVLFSTDGTLIADHGVDGTITTNTDNTGTIIIGVGDVGVIGEDDKKLKQIHLNQTTASSIGKVYASNVNIGGVGPILFNDNIHANNIDIDNSHIGISDNIAIYGNINASNTNILLDHNRLTLRGTNTFANKIIISSTYDEYSLSGGNVILISGSTLDLSNVSSLIIKLSCINSNISKINNTTKYNIILAEDGSNIILLDDPEHHIILDSSGEQNKFVKWTLDVSSLTLYASDDSDTVIDNDYVFDSVQNNTFMQELKNALPSSAAQEFKNNIGLLSKQRVEEMLSRILDYPQGHTSDIVRVALHQTLTDANRSAMHAIHNRVFGANLAVVASGDEDVSKYGVWARSSINQSKDKVNSRSAEYFSSYKTRGHSNTIGADGLICDNLLVGAAYTNAYTSIRPKYQDIGNIDKVRTNMFSLYSAYNIPNYNWYLDSIVSYAESSIRGQKIRYLAVARDILGNEVAFSKYKSRLYSGSISLGYYHHIGKDIYVTPSIGMIGSLIRDRGYTESGTSFQNLTVRQKNYSKLSGVAGLRTYQDIYLGNNADSVIVTPEAYGFVNYNIKNKTPAIDARLNGIDKRLPTIINRSNRIDYNVGLGITIKQNMMEYGINYDTNLAHKYQGHSGSLKVRVNL